MSATLCEGLSVSSEVSRRTTRIKRLHARTKVNIIEAAERLIGLRGINGVTQREIVVAAGSAHNDAITYYFRNLSGLVNAIFEHRLPVAESRRGELLAATVFNHREPSIRDLIVVLYQPLTEQRDRRGCHSYAAFLAGLLRFPKLGVRYKRFNEHAAAARAIELLAKSLPHLSQGQFWSRFAAVDDMVLTGIARLQTDDDNVSFAELVDMAAAAMQAGCRPLSQSAVSVQSFSN